MMKRSRPYTNGATRPSTKRPKVDTDLAHIWDKLADDTENVRLDAACELLTNQCAEADLEKAEVIARRLFKGLCSGRKNARPGFYVALVGALSMSPCPFGAPQLRLTEILQLLEAQTTPDTNTSGQDERDHHFGRLLGCKALLESTILSRADSDLKTGWGQILEIVCKLMAQKPWLRPEGASLICSSISQQAQSSSNSEPAIAGLVSQVFEQLRIHKLLRTIDGVKIWLYVQDIVPTVSLPKDVWISQNPLNSSNLKTLKKTLLDTQLSGDDEAELLGTSGWSPKLHETWSMVLQRLSRPRTKSQVTLEKFWQDVVEDGLFAPSSTPERKFTGFLVLGDAIKEVEISSIPNCFSKNLMATVVQALRSTREAYLKSIITDVFTDIRSRPGMTDTFRADMIIHGLLAGSDFTDFDTLCKTRIVSSLFEVVQIDHEKGIFNDMFSWLRSDPGNDKDQARVAQRRKNTLNILQRAVCHHIHSCNLSSADHSEQGEAWDHLTSLIQRLLDLKRATQVEGKIDMPYDDSTHSVLKDKISQIMESLLAAGQHGRACFFNTIAQLKHSDLEAEEMICRTVEISWKHFVELQRRTRESDRKDPAEGGVIPGRLRPREGMNLLLATLIYQVYDGDVESAEILEDVNSMAEDVLAKHDDGRVSNHIPDIVLSLTSRSSKLFRRAGGQIFEAFSTHMSSVGLKSLCDVLTTKESRDGQLELFEDGDVEPNEESQDSDVSDGGSVDSDVEVVDENNGSDTTDSEDNDNSDSVGETTDDKDENDDELANFESALAAALGTRKLNEDDLGDDDDDDAGSSSDSDMSDSEMMELDTKLAEVFRNQQSQASAQKVQKEETRSAKENVINLKNRAMDLVELFLRAQQTRGTECIELLSSLLQLAGTTTTHQLANRAIELVKGYAQKSRAARLPKVQDNDETRAMFRQHLQNLHALIVEKDVSNALIDAAGQTNVLLCKLLIEAGQKDVMEIANKVSSEQGSKRDVRRKALRDFWSRYDAWASTVQLKEQELPSQTSRNGNEANKQHHAGSLVSARHKKGKARA